MFRESGHGCYCNKQVTAALWLISEAQNYAYLV
jgi:hypothetical protein